MSEPVEPDPARLRSLHDRGLTPDQIRRLTPEQITRSRYFPARTILTWLTAEATDAATAALPQQASMSPSNTSPRAVVPGDGIPPEEDHRALHAKVALLEAQLRRRSFEQASRTPSPARSALISPECAHPGPGFMERQDRETIDHLKQVNTQLVALVTAALGAVERREPAPLIGPTMGKPFKDWLPQVKAYAGEPDRTPEAFLTQYYLYARQQNVPAAERARQLINKLTGPAQIWYTLTFANEAVAATESQIALGLRKQFGQEYAGVKALRAVYQVNPLPTQSGAQRLLTLDHREEQARQHRVPRDAGPFETRFSRVLALFLPAELNHFLGELTADNRCSEEALRQLEETPDLFEAPDATGRASLAPTSPARETLFSARVQLAEAALRRIPAPASGPERARLARTEGSSESPTSLEPQPAMPPPVTPSPPAGYPDDYLARCSRVATEHATQSTGGGFAGPPHYFGDN